MIKLLDLIEGAKVSNGNVLLSKVNGFNEPLLFKPNFTYVWGLNIYYSLEYNPKFEKEQAKEVADALKHLDGVTKEDLKPIVLEGIKIMLTKSLKSFPNEVYFLGSGAPLSKVIGEIIKEEFDIELIPLSKIKYPTWQDMLIDDYQNKISSKIIPRIEKIAQEMWEDNEQEIKSSYLNPPWRQYFKPKYKLEDLKNPKALFIDDNFQTGADFKSIRDHFGPNHSHKLLFYTLIKLSK